MTLTPGLRLKSAVCETQIVVVKAGPAGHALTCGGAAMLGMAESPPDGVALDAAYSAGTAVGKRYQDASGAFEFLCTRGGKGSLALDGVALAAKPPRALPTSD